MTNMRQLIREHPKSELHCHIGGSAHIHTLTEFAQDITGRNDPDLTGLITKRVCYDPFLGDGIDTYLKRFPATEMLVYRAGNLARVAYELIRTCSIEGIQNIDVRFSPDIAMLWGRYQSIIDVVMEVVTGLELGEIAFGVKWGLILCFLPKLGPDLANDHLWALHKAVGMYNLHYRLGIDIAGPMEDFNPENWSRLYMYANDDGFITTVHAGEALSGEHLYEVLKHLKPKRIGHGIRCVENKDAMDYIMDNGITMEVCPSSNIQCIQPNVPYDVMDTICDLINKRFPVTINTDNRTISNTDLISEYVRLLDTGKIPEEMIFTLLRRSNNAWKDSTTRS